MDLNNLRQITRPVIAIIIMLTLSLAIFFAPDPPGVLLLKYMKWGGGVILFYFSSRTIEKFRGKG
jgi:hypothetical protein